MTIQKITLLTGVFGCMVGVMLGAFGAHALKGFLVRENRFDTFQTATQYLFYHSLGLLLLGVVMFYFQNGYLNWASRCMSAGILFFSGSLYLLCFTGVRALGAITPFGGVLFIVAWALMAVGIGYGK